MKRVLLAAIAFVTATIPTLAADNAPLTRLLPGVHRLACLAHDLGGHPLIIHIKLQPKAIWIRIGDARASGTDPVISYDKTSVTIAGGTRLIVLPHGNITLVDPTFGEALCELDD
jgi:hypothetical protein